MAECFECGSKGRLHNHHVVPKSRGGTRTIPLCEQCHARSHGKSGDFTTSQLTRDALWKKKMKGEYTGGKAPYGYRVAADGVSLVKDDAEQKVIAAVLEYCEAGLSLRKIGKRLEAEGFTTRKGGKFWPTAIKNILDNNGDVSEQ